MQTSEISGSKVCYLQFPEK